MKRKIFENFLKIFLASPQNLSRDVANVDSEVLALPLLREFRRVTSPLVVAVPSAVFADALCGRVNELAKLARIDVNCLVLPEGHRGKIVFPGAESARARALDIMLGGKFQILLASAAALVSPAPEPEIITASSLCLRPGMTLSPNELARHLTALDYDNEYEVTVAGEFAARGGVFDVYSPAHDLPCRIEYFGDEIESLRLFSPDSQRSVSPIDSYEIICRGGVTAGGEASGDALRYLEVRDQYRLLVCYPQQIEEKLAELSGADRRFLDVWEKLRSEKRATAFYDSVESSAHPEVSACGILVRQPAAPVKNRSVAENTVKQLLKLRLDDAVKRGRDVVFFVPEKAEIPQVTKFVAALRSAAAVEFAVGKIQSGFSVENPPLEVVAFSELLAAGYRRKLGADESESTEAESDQTPQKPQEDNSTALRLDDFDVGDYVVHLDHGIGIFRGFKNLSSGGVEREVICIEYRDGQLLYVPLLNADKVSRYLGSAGRLSLHKLGGSRWKNEKNLARTGVRSYAADMLRFQALRNAISGISYPEMNRDYNAFVRAFPFTDTPDQRRASNEIRADMLSSRPMDRLLCGDVGYGKTEVAIRAAWRAAAAGFQTAVIAPTTVLAQQHLKSFTERFAAYPFTIGALNRFVPPARQAEVLSQLESGALDIVIGTHALCSGKVRFKNLGLVIIDEEQRFGVEHKECLRRFRAEADVLAMSATPIPRTLYLAMAGARDLSTLMTPPQFRLPVKTVVAPDDDKLILGALRAELLRGGQIYYVHNRVRTIDECADRLRNLVPEMRVAVAHGQMPERALEQTMSDFLAGKIDCLVCSSIVESGLDVPNANTMIIERADRFGLAELYQLRGRVGRWKQQAFAFLLLPKSQMVRGDARKRLSAIRKCSHLGAGFQLALHDLEIRGSGNILGAEQSGHLNAIGFDLYCQLLKQEVTELKGEKLHLTPDAEVAIDFVSFAINAPSDIFAASIPPSYINYERLRAGVYRKLARIGEETELEAFKDELLDRFGELPRPVQNLFAIAKLRILTGLAGFRRLMVVNGEVSLSAGVGSSVFRYPNGKVPRLDKRDSVDMRIAQLTALLRQILSNAKKAQQSGVTKQV